MAKLFISFEGIEAVGKGTQIGLLKESLLVEGIKVAITREPGGTPMAEKIRNLLKHDPDGHELKKVPQAEALLMMAARALNSAMVFRALDGAEVDVFISDRFIDSSVAYQAGGRKLDIKTVNWLNDFATQFRKPDVTFLLNISVEESISRSQKRSGQLPIQFDRFEEEKKAFFESVRKAYLDLAAREPSRIVVIDASPTDPKLIAKEIWKHVETRLARINR